MGWASGSEVARDMIESLQKYVEVDKVRRWIYCDLIDSLTSMDWDTVDEALGIDPEFDNAVREKFPHWDLDWFD